MLKFSSKSAQGSLWEPSLQLATVRLQATVQRAGRGQVEHDLGALKSISNVYSSCSDLVVNKDIAMPHAETFVEISRLERCS